jgi:hypothetical protein
MPNEALNTYLNDHLAGSVIALELLEWLQNEEPDSPDTATLASIQKEIEADRQALEDLLHQLEFEISQPRQALAWVTEKLGQVKLRLDDSAHGALRRLEALETIAIGISGKQALWRALAAAAPPHGPLAKPDYPALLRRAADQFDVVETLRLSAARNAFTDRG